MRKSIDALVTSTDQLLAATKSLSDQQEKSLAFLTDMDAALQTSVTNTRLSTTAMQTQLKILQKDQQDRLAELAKKPAITAAIGSVLLTGAKAGEFIHARELTPTKAVYEITIENSGTSTLLYGQVHVGVLGAGITLSCDCPSEPTRLPEAVKAEGYGILIYVDRLRPGIHVTNTITAEFAQGTNPFSIQITVDGDNYPLATLGTFIVTPPQK